MAAIFYVSAVIAIVATLLAVSSLNAFHALLFLVGSLVAVAVVFVALGAPFVAVIEMTIYAGAIVVLIVFAVMMLNIGEPSVRRERLWLSGRGRAAAAVLAVVVSVELGYLVLADGWRSGLSPIEPTPIGPEAVALSLFGPYVLGVELISMLLLGGLVAAFQVGWRRRSDEGSDGIDTIRTWSRPGGSAVRHRSFGAPFAP